MRGFCPIGQMRSMYAWFLSYRTDALYETDGVCVLHRTDAWFLSYRTDAVYVSYTGQMLGFCPTGQILCTCPTPDRCVVCVLPPDRCCIYTALDRTDATSNPLIA
jgi:hypothetical protein